MAIKKVVRSKMIPTPSEKQQQESSKAVEQKPSCEPSSTSLTFSWDFGTPNTKFKRREARREQLMPIIHGKVKL